MEQTTAILIGGTNWKDLLEDYISKNGEENLEVLLSIPLTDANEEFCRELSHLITFKNFYKNKPTNIDMSNYTKADNIIDLQNNNNNNNLYTNTLLQGVNIHLLGIPTLPIRDELRFSPYVGINESMIEILNDLDLNVIHYGIENSNIKCNEDVSIIKEDEFNEYVRDIDTLGVSLECFKHTVYTDIWQKYFRRVKIELESRFNKTEYGDIVLIPHCLYATYLEEEMKIKWKNRGISVIEYSAGYPGRGAQFVVFPSYTQMNVTNTLDGLLENNEKGYSKVNHYDYVIPHSFDHNKYTKLDNPDSNYLLYLGRIQPSKGWYILKDLAYKYDLDMPIKLAGPIANILKDEVNQGIEDGKFCYEGVVGLNEKVKLLSNAKALLAPSEVHEIFHMAGVEAMLSGTPVICSESGGLVENVIHNKTGYICKSLSDYYQAILRVGNLNREYIREYAVLNFSNDSVKYRYQEMFRRVYSVMRGDGWYSTDGFNLLNTVKQPKLKKDKVLVIVAHQDDELIEHGLFLKRSLDDITVVIATKSSDITPNPLGLSLEDLTKIRKLETLAFCNQVGVKDVRFLDLDDGNINKELLDLEAKKLIRELNPDIILTHSDIDAHPDHKIIADVIEENKKFGDFSTRCRSLGNEVNYVNRLYNDDVNWKLDMMYKYFKSQTPILLMDQISEYIKYEGANI